MSNTSKCNGIVTSHLLNITSMIEYAHEDGRICARPGPSDLAIGTLVESEFRVEFGLCEHTILAVHDMTAEPEEKSVTVADILQTRSNLPDDVPVSEELIAKAKVPPKIRRDPSTTPARTTDIPVENRFEFDLDTEELRELNAIRGIHDEAINTGTPTSPFAEGFNGGRTPSQPSGPKRKSGPISPFDWK